MRPGPKCSHCAEPVPLRRWSLGKVFQCSGCDTHLVMSLWNAALWGGAAAVIFALLRDQVRQVWGGPGALLAVLVIVILPLSWVTMKTRPAKVC